MPIIHSSLQDTTNYAVTNQLLKVNSCGSLLYSGRPLNDGHSVRRPKGRKDYQLIYLTMGQGQFFLNNTWQTVQAGQLVLFQPNEAQFYTYPAHTPVQGKWIHFSGSEAGAILNQSGLIAAGPLMDIGESREILGLWDRLILENQQALPCRDLLSQALLFELISLLGRQLIICRDAGAYHARKKIMQIAASMHKNFTQCQSLDDYAAQCGMSKYHFSHLFRTCIGKSPYAYLTSIRMEQAKLLLDGSELSIGEVARECGYDNPLYFSRAFSSHVGCSPSHYRMLCLSASESP